MATRAFIIPRRLDLSGAGLQVVDLVPNTSQRNSSLDGEGQSGYLKFSCDRPGLTTVNGANYASGSRNTSPLANTAVADVNGGGNESTITVGTHFGLLAYLQERVNVNPGGDNDFITSAEAVNIVNDILARVYNGLALTAADIKVILDARLAGADNTLVGAAEVGGSNSFGTVEEVLRILSGETYRVRDNTILGDQNGVFTSLAARTAVANAAAGVFIGDVFVQGAFVARGAGGFHEVKPLALTEAVRLSAKGGRLARMIGANNLVVTNPAFAYVAGDVNAFRPRALTVNGANVPATGSDRVAVVYDSTGALIN